MAVRSEPRAILDESIISILGQTFADFEFIVVCDSPDDADVCEQLFAYAEADPRMIILINEKACGFARSINRAIAVSQGKYVVRMDADDVSLPERIQQQVEFMERSPHIGICGMQAEVVDEQGRLVGRMQKPCRPENVVAYLFHASPLVHPTYIVRRRVYELLGGYREFSPGQDYELLIRARRAGVLIANQPIVGLRYRINESSLSHRSLIKTMKMGQLMRRLARDDCQDMSVDVALRQYEDGVYLRELYKARNAFIQRARRGSLLYKMFFMTAGALVSFLHFDLLRDTYHGLQGARIVRKDAAELG